MEVCSTEKITKIQNNFFSSQKIFLYTWKALIHSLWVSDEKVMEDLGFKAIKAS